jgi:hypothetical protein
MRVACVGDLHGVDRWKEIIKENCDQIVFVGDYVDSYEMEDEIILQNFKEVIDFKAENPSSVILLLGNHDYHYYHFPDYRCTGFRPSMVGRLQSIFHENANFFQISHSVGNTLFTHAGLSRKWVEKFVRSEWSLTTELVTHLNDLSLNPEGRASLTTIGKYRGGGEEGIGGPLWCDFDYELILDPLPGYDQVVGHTRKQHLVRHNLQSNTIYNVNYLAYSDHPILILDISL